MAIHSNETLTKTYTKTKTKNKKQTQKQSFITGSVYVMDALHIIQMQSSQKHSSWNTINKDAWWKSSAVAYLDAVPGKFPR